MYDKFPYVPVAENASECSLGWNQIARTLRESCRKGRTVVCLECYPGTFSESICESLQAELQPTLVQHTERLFLSPATLESRLSDFLTNDPVFGRMNSFAIEDFFDEKKLAAARNAIQHAADGLILIAGTGATIVAGKWDLLVYADLARWEIQLRQRRGEIGNLGAQNRTELPSLKYKRAFFVDWRSADRLKQKLLPSLDFLLDTNDALLPKMITGKSLRRALQLTAGRPFRVVPYFDPGPWGGHWMEKVCDLPTAEPNYAWCFDCVPEENSLLLGYGNVRVEVPSIDLVFSHPEELLGSEVYQRFGAEFPIRFDFLDTMGGGNLSLQVHPLTEYIREKFGMAYTQDESYYVLDAAADGSVFLGLKKGIDSQSMLRDLATAQSDGVPFDANKYVNSFPARKHDHFLIPAGTVHCSGKNTMVLEISATPYIFTFKLWDWDRMGLNGRPRPIHLEHGAANICWNRTTDWVSRSLINRVEPLASGDGSREERTGLHEFEFIETRRHWFTKAVAHNTNSGVNVLNLVEGNQAVVESPTGAFAPFEVHYAETFIVPAQVGAYTIRPTEESEGEECATIKAFVRPRK